MDSRINNKHITTLGIERQTMNTLYFQLKSDLVLAMKLEVEHRKGNTKLVEEAGGISKALAHKTVSRAIISMIPQLGKKSDETTEEDIQKLLKKYISQEKERAVYQFGHLKEADVDGKSSSEVKKLVNNKIQELGDNLSTLEIQVAQEYLPKQATEEEIIEWINENLDLSQFKNKMQAMGPIMKQFKGCDGNFVKGILLKM